MDSNKKFLLYFFDPNNNEEEYSKTFRRLSGGATVAYSPLYLLRRQILLLSGKINGLKKSIQQIPYFSAILLSNIAISGLAELTNTSERINYEDFYEKYLGKNIIQLLGLRLLRNSLEHNNFQLFTQIYKSNKNNTKQMFDKIVEYLSSQPDWNGIWRVDQRLIDYIKIDFALGKNLGGQIVSNPSIQRYDPKKRYIRARYQVDPFRFFERLESGIDSVKKEIDDNITLSNQFDELITIEDWMKVYNA